MSIEHTARFVSVLRALALAGTAASIPALAGCARSATGASVAATTVCPASAPSTNESCAGHVVDHECEWYGAIRCTCQNTANSSTPQWACITRGAPGPLPPPEFV